MAGKKATKPKKTSFSELKRAVISGTILFSDIVKLMEDRECFELKQRTVSGKMDRENGADLNTIPENDVLEITVSESSGDKVPKPSSGPMEYDSDPFPESESEDVLNNARELYSTDRSIVTIEDQDAVIKRDPFKDGDKILGQRQGNPYSNTPMTMRRADPILLYSEVMAQGLNEKSYVEKLEQRRKDMVTQKLNVSTDVTAPRIDDTEEKRRLDADYKRYVLDCQRREAKVPEPNVIDRNTGECSAEWREWFQRRLRQIEDWLVEDAINGLPPSHECEPPEGVSLLAADWRVFRRHEVNVEWNYEKYGPMLLTDEMAFDGEKLYNPLTGRVWENIIEHLECAVKKKFAEKWPGGNYDVFEENNGYFWSLCLQQWYDIINVSSHSPLSHHIAPR